MVTTVNSTNNKLFVAEILNGNYYPGNLEVLLKAFGLLGPWEYKWAWWSSILDTELSLFNIRDKKSFHRYEQWQAAYAMINPEIKPEVLQLTKDYLMAQDTQLPQEFMDKLNAEIKQLEQGLNERIPEFGIQLQTVMGRLQEMPEATWALTDEQRKVIVDGFKANVNVTVFRAEKTASIKNHKIKGPISEDMF